MHKLKKTSVKITKVIDCFFAKMFYSFNCLPQAVALLPYIVSLARMYCLLTHKFVCQFSQYCLFEEICLYFYQPFYQIIQKLVNDIKTPLIYTHLLAVQPIMFARVDFAVLVTSEPL